MGSGEVMSGGDFGSGSGEVGSGHQHVHVGSGEVGSGEALPGTPSRNRSSAGCTSLSSLAMAMRRRLTAISAEFGEVHLSDHPVLAPHP